MIKVSDDLIVNPMHVASISWDRGHSYTAMLIHMADGTKHRLRHSPSPYGGTDCYKAEAAIVAAYDRAIEASERLA
ncbi:hypothetical protein [Sphingomonas sp. VDB2]|uniref:hypothetical protein n=1 Tax=Sphingomonas sp. VDB2 TaxID=3228751 RepID=UPI003A7FB144